MPFVLPSVTDGKNNRDQRRATDDGQFELNSRVQSEAREDQNHHASVIPEEKLQVEGSFTQPFGLLIGTHGVEKQTHFYRGLSIPEGDGSRFGAKPGNELVNPCNNCGCQLRIRRTVQEGATLIGT